ncbi:MAG: peptidoglycan DD-metalloendopeptidase family protein [Moorea sp. SIO2B7]|nr:peptidoglycan DD-metalloendopeptidase family protein [Moorena sp. SIO2B7]
MKDVFVQKVKPVPSFPEEASEASAKLFIKAAEGVTDSNEGQRRVRQSAAMIGLAISMGATGMLLPNQEDQVMAAESVPSELNLTSLSAKKEAVDKSSQAKVALQPTPSVTESSTAKVAVKTHKKIVGELASSRGFKKTKVVEDAPSKKVAKLAPPVIKHKVTQGETLWELSKNYDVAPEAIAASNKIPSKSTLSIGQTLKIPPVNGIVHEVKAKETVETISTSYGLKPSQLESSRSLLPSEKLSAGESVIIPGKVDDLLRNRQETALANLKKHRKDLKTSLAELRSDESKINPQKDHGFIEESDISPKSITLSTEDNLGYLPQITASHSSREQKNSLILSVSSPERATPPTLEKQEVANGNTSIPIPVSLPETPDLSTSQTQELANFNSPILIPVPLPGTSAEGTSKPGETVVIGLEPVRENQPRNQRQNLSRLDLPQPVVVATSPGPFYTVKRGDTLNRIARKHGVSLSELARANNIRNPNQIKVNQQLRIPGNRLARNPNQSMTVIPGLPFASQKKNTTLLSLNSRLNNPVPIPSRLMNLEWEKNQRSTSNNAVESSARQHTESRVRGSRTSSSPPVASRQQLMAIAPIEVENYNGKLRTPVGETVSPQLPSLSPDQYLPASPDQFNGYTWPAKGVLTSGYGWRWGRMHKGIDIAAPIGTPITAAASGEVISAGWNSGGYGNLVKLKHPDGSMTLYAHNNRILVRRGQKVKQGQQIAEMGSTGYSTGPHLHFEIHPNGSRASNPMAFLPRKR